MKLKYFIALLLLSICIPVHAQEVTTALTGKTNIESGEEFNLSLKITGENVWGITGNLVYDKSKLTVKKI